MRKQFRILLFAMLVAILVVMTALVISADYTVTDKNGAPVGENEGVYATLADAVGAVTDGGTITVNGDVEDVATDLTKEGVSYTIKGGSTEGMNKLTVTASTFGSNTTLLYLSKGSVTIENLSIVGNATTAIHVHGGYRPTLTLNNVHVSGTHSHTLWLRIACTLTIMGENTRLEGGTWTIINAQSGVSGYDTLVDIQAGTLTSNITSTATDSRATIVMYHHQKLTVSGGTVEARGKSSAILIGKGALGADQTVTEEMGLFVTGGSVTAVNTDTPKGGAIYMNGDGATLTVGGTASVSGGNGIYINSKATVTINDGTVKGNPGSGIVVFALDSVVTVNGGTVSSEGTKNGVSAGSDANKAAIHAFAGHAVWLRSASSFTMTGGTLTNTGSCAVLLTRHGSETDSGNSVVYTIKISGGSITSAASNAMPVYLQQGLADLTVSGEAVIRATGTYAMWVGNANTVTVSGGLIEATTSQAVVFNSGTFSSFTVNGGTIKASSRAIYVYAASSVREGGTGITVTGTAVLESTAYRTIQLAGAVPLTISGEAQLKCPKDGYCIDVTSTAEAGVDITISGGTLNAGNSTGVIAISLAGVVNSFEMTGGAVLTSKVALLVKNTNADGTVSISGGTLNSVYHTIEITSAAAVSVSGSATINTASGGYAVYLTAATDASFTMTGGSIAANAGTGIVAENSSIKKLSISNATITATARAIYLKNTNTLSEGGVVEIAGTAISAGSYAVQLEFAAGEVVISDTTITTTHATASAIYVNNANLSVKIVGTYDAEKEAWTSQLRGPAGIVVNYATTVTVNGAKITATVTAGVQLSCANSKFVFNAGEIVAEGDTDNGSNAVWLNSNGTALEMTGGTLKAAKSAVLGHHKSAAASYIYRINISGGTVTSTGATAIAVTASTAETPVTPIIDLTISGGLVTSTATHAIHIEGPIKNLVIDGTYDAESETWSTELKGADRVLYLDAGATLATGGTGVTIKGGSFDGQKYTVDIRSSVPVTITGGEIFCPATAATYPVYVGAEAGSNVAILGATITGGAEHTVYLASKVNTFEIGGDAVITNATAGKYTFQIASGVTLASESSYIMVSGGTIKHTAGGRAININSAVTFTMTGGNVSSSDRAIYVNAAAIVNISGGNLTTTGSAAAIQTQVAGASVTIGGILRNDGKWSTVIKGGSDGVLINSKNTTVTINGGEIIGVTGAGLHAWDTGTKFIVNDGYITAEGNTENKSVAIWLHSTTASLEMTGGTLVASQNAILGYHSSATAAYIYHITISGGTITSTDTAAITVAKGTAMPILDLTVSGGIISSEAVAAISIPSGSEATVTISGGQITGVGKTIEVASAAATLNISGGTIVCDSISAYSGTVAISAAANVTISGGNIVGVTKGDRAGAVYVAAAMTLDVTGGTITQTTSGTATLVGGIFAQTSGATINISGTYDEETGEWSTRIEGYYALYANTKAFFTMDGGHLVANASAAVLLYGGSATFTLNDGLVESYPESGSNMFGVWLRSASTVFTMTGGEVRSKVTAVWAGASSTKVVISGGSLYGADQGVRQNAASTCTVTGGVVAAGNYALYLSNASAAATVSGGVLRTTANATVRFGANVSFTMTGGVLICSQQISPIFKLETYTPTVNISSGVFAPIYSGKITDGAAIALPSDNFALVSLATSITIGETQYTLSGAHPVHYNYEICNTWVKYTATNATYAPTMQAGAALRVTDVQFGTGLRFTSTVPADVVTAIKSMGTPVYGTLIAPLDYVLAAGSGFTHASLAAYGEQIGKTAFVDIVANHTFKENSDGSVSFSGALCDIKTANTSRKFAAVSYVLVGGKYYYSAFDYSSNSTSIKEIAIAAMKNVSADQAGDYLYPSISSDKDCIGKYSKYTRSQQQFLNKYAGLALIPEA